MTVLFAPTENKIVFPRGVLPRAPAARRPAFFPPINQSFISIAENPHRARSRLTLAD